MAEDFISQLFMPIMVFRKSLNACVPGSALPASAAARAAIVAVAKSTPLFNCATSAVLYLAAHTLLLPPLARSRLSAKGFTL